MRDSLTAECRRDYYPAVHTSGTRLLRDIEIVAMHDEEADTAKSAAVWFLNPASGGSAHLAVDDVVCYRCLPNGAIPWGSSSAPQLSSNRHGFHIEQAGYARWSAVIWMKHWRTLKRAAYKTAYHLDRFDLPATFLTSAMLVENARAGKRSRGVTTHAEITKASKILDPANASNYNHTDPGLFWPRRTFMKNVRKYLAEIQT